MPGPREAYAELISIFRRGATLQSVDWMLQWDQETYMPPAGADGRSEQCSLLAELQHGVVTQPRIGDLLATCEGDASFLGSKDSITRANVREMRRDFDKATKLPSSLVAEHARVTSKAQSVWKQAREKNDFPLFAPWLGQVVELTRQKAECFGVPKGGEIYDAVLDQYEPGMTSAEVERVFAPLRTRLAAFVGEYSKRKGPPTKVLDTKITAEKQHAFGMKLLEAIGFDLNAGRLDTTTHPFCQGVGPGDTRLTTRYRESRFTDAMYGTLHEAGHGIYEQGLPKAKRFGEPLAEAASLGIHESQSRMWENFVGRSKAFWTFALPIAKKMLGGLGAANVDTMFRAVNTVKPSFIRVEADESTYNLHVMLRFDIERRLMKGDVKIKDVPALWNETFTKYLGLTVPDVRRGCLQDVHWSAGLIGYFPTYTLGNIYCAQMWEKISADLPDLSKHIAKGKFGDLKAWLVENVHQHGRRYRAPDLAKRITGKPISHEPLMAYLENKIGAVYAA